MLIYKKYIAKTIIGPLIAFGLVLTTMIWITQIIRLLYLIDKGVAVLDFLNFTILIVPSLIFMVSPLISVISIIYVYSKLQEERQLLILKTSGLSNFSIIKPALIVATVITLISYYISFSLLPFSYNKLKDGLNNFQESYLSNIIDERTFNQISKYTTLYIAKKQPNGTLGGIILFDNKIPNHHSIVFAKSGKLIVNDNVPVFQLENGFRQSFDDNNNLTNLSFDNLVIELKSDKKNISRDRVSYELYIKELLWPNNILTTERKNHLIIDGHQRLIWPFFNYCLVFLSLSIFMNTPYNRKISYKQMAYTILPVFIVGYFHFTLQKLAYKEPLYIFALYLNIIVCMLLSIWLSIKKRI